MQRWRADELLRAMRMIFPRSVTDAARTAADTGPTVLDHHETNYQVRRADDPERRHWTEQDRLAAQERFRAERDDLLDELQRLMFDD